MQEQLCSFGQLVNLPEKTISSSVKWKHWSSPLLGWFWGIGKIIWTCELLRPKTDTEQGFSKRLSLGVVGSSGNTARMLATPRLLMLETSCGVSEGGPGRSWGGVGGLSWVREAGSVSPLLYPQLVWASTFSTSFICPVTSHSWLERGPGARVLHRAICYIQFHAPFMKMNSGPDLGSSCPGESPRGAGLPSQDPGTQARLYLERPSFP